LPMISATRTSSPHHLLLYLHLRSAHRLITWPTPSAMWRWCVIFRKLNVSGHTPYLTVAFSVSKKSHYGQLMCEFPIHTERGAQTGDFLNLILYTSCATRWLKTEFIGKCLEFTEGNQQTLKHLFDKERHNL
jgi:hypothetical protein